jgi:putative transposase
VSESSVYRILKAKNLIPEPVYSVISAKDKFQNPTTRINELWQTDFTYFKIISWGWYYLSTVLDDYSRYILAWKLCTSMTAEDVKATLDVATEKTGFQDVKLKHRPRLLSDNGPCYISSSLKDYLEEKKMTHIQGRPFHPMTQGKIERYHRSMKNIILLDNYYSPSELEYQIQLWVDYYNHERYHEAIGNITPRDKYLGFETEIFTRRAFTKSCTMEKRKQQYR